MCGPCAADESVARRFIRACGTSATRHRIAGIINQNPRAPSLSAPRTRDDDCHAARRRRRGSASAVARLFQTK